MFLFVLGRIISSGRQPSGILDSCQFSVVSSAGCSLPPTPHPPPCGIENLNLPLKALLPSFFPLSLPPSLSPSFPHSSLHFSPSLQGAFLSAPSLTLPFQSQTKGLLLLLLLLFVICWFSRGRKDAKITRANQHIWFTSQCNSDREHMASTQQLLFPALGGSF